MSVKFRSYESRVNVAAMLEAPARVLNRAAAGFPTTVAEGNRAEGDVAEIIAELDRMDDVRRAEEKLKSDYDAFRREAIAAGVKVVPITDGLPIAYCTEDKSWNGYSRYSRQHKAKVTLNGVPYCGTHLRRAEEHARSKAVLNSTLRPAEDAKARAIIDADRALRKTRTY